MEIVKMKQLALAIGVTLFVGSTAAFAIPDPEGQSMAEPRASDVIGKIEDLAAEAKNMVGFREANHGRRIYNSYAGARKRIEQSESADDRRMAVRELHDLAGQGYGPALNYVGYLLDNGIQVRRDNRGAAQFFFEAAKRGDMHGRHNYALALILGRGAEQNEVAGLKLLEENAKRRFTYSAVACGIYHENKKNIPRAKSCYAGATGDRGHPIARTRVAIFELRNRSSANDQYKNAKILLTQAARLGWPEAQWTLAEMERFGIGGKPNAFRTAFWLRILQKNPNINGTKYTTEVGRVFGEIMLDDKASKKVDQAVEIWIRSNGRNLVPVIDYTASIPDDLRE